MISKLTAAFVALISFHVLAVAETPIKLSGAFHYTPIQYSGSFQKEKAMVTRVYSYLGYTLEHSFEGAVDYTEIDYKTGEDLRQYDYTLLYTHYRPSYKIMLGSHLITNNIEESDPLVLFAGVNRHVIGDYDVQLSFYYSRYGEGMNAFTVLQVVPEYGKVILRGVHYNFHARIRGYYIRLDEEIGIDETDLYSAEGMLSYYYKKVGITAYGWTGEQLFAVRHGGFTVYNLAEKHVGGYGVAVSYIPNPRTSVNLGYSSEDFIDIYADAEDKADILSFSVVHGF